jgi:cytochrome c5
MRAKALLASAIFAVASLAASQSASQTSTPSASQPPKSASQPPRSARQAPNSASQPKSASAKANAKADADPTLSAVVGPAENAELAALPEGPGKTLVAERCLLCHSAGMIAQQHKDAAAWGRTVTQMRTWGSPIQDADQAAIVTYLTDHFGPAAPKR